MNRGDGRLELSLVDRETGTIPLSIGTALAFEALFGIHPNPPKQTVNIKTINEIWVNLKTLTRNLYQAVPTAKTSSLDLQACIDLLYSEIELFPVLMETYKLNIKVVPYITSTIDVEYEFPKAAFKKPKTPKQIAYQYFEDYVVEGLHQRLKSEKQPLIEVHRKPERINRAVAFLTHLPNELLWKDQFDRLVLLESHTGRLKSYNEWYTKLHSLKQSKPIPFNRFTLQVFGDSVLIEPQNRIIRGQLLQLAESRRWSPVTTQDKFYHDITTHGTKELIECYRLLR